MARVTPSLFAFNRGIVSKRALARTDVERVRLSAEIQENWIPKTQGSMIMRPGLEYISASKGNAFAIDLPFIASTDDTAILELTQATMRVRLPNGLVTRPSVTTTIQNGDFGDAAGWVDESTDGATTTIASDKLTLFAEAKGSKSQIYQEINILSGSIGVEHALEIYVSRGPVTFRAGSSQGTDDEISETTLFTGYHSLSITPTTSSIFIQFETKSNVAREVFSCVIASEGVMEITTPWLLDDLRNIRKEQSADVVFVACEGHRQRRIERRSSRSWSLVDYAPDDGPFQSSRTADLRLKVDNNNGNTILTSSEPFFKPEHVGTLFRIYCEKTNRLEKIAAEGTWTEPIRVTGVNASTAVPPYNDRNFNLTIEGTWSGTVRLSRSYDDEETGYNNFDPSYTANLAETSITDDDDNAIVYYRVGYDFGEYTSGTAEINIEYDGDGDYGICRVNAVSSSTTADVEVLKSFPDTEFSDNWQEGVWSDLRGWPSTVVFHRGRLWWLGGARVIGSVSDDYGSFDPEFEGDGGPISRSLGTGPVDIINFGLSLNRLVAGTASNEFSIKSTSFDEPLTPTNTQSTDPSSQGSKSRVRAVKIDNRGVFAARSGKRIFELIADSTSGDYRPADLTLLAPDITGDATVIDFAVQRQPDTRLHVLLSDGTVALLTYEPDEDVVCWTRIDAGFVVSICVLPSIDEDEVYYRVKRTINSKTKYYLERFALEREAIGGTVNKIADSFVAYSGAAISVVTGADHLEGCNVIVWADGKSLGSFRVTSGTFTLPTEHNNIVYGLPYAAKYKSAKLAYGAQAGTALTMKKTVKYLGLIMQNVSISGIKFGQTFDDMDNLKLVQGGVEYDADHVFEEYDEASQALPGGWDTDSRLCLECNAPYAAEILAGVLSVETNEKV